MPGALLLRAALLSLLGCSGYVAPLTRRTGPVRVQRGRSQASMKVRVGLIGLPNVGKSTLFNALARKAVARAENFPFCTIEPNVAPIALPDPYLEELGALAGSTRTVPAALEVVDVAGLVRGASRGEGLGNRFLAVARECDAICHVVRAFEDDETVHVDGRVDPAADAEVINLELILADLEHARRRLEKAACRGAERDALDAVARALERGLPARAANLSAAAALSVKSMGLLTLKPALYAFNVDEVEFLFARADARAAARRVFDGIAHRDARAVLALVSAKLEAELAAKDEGEQIEYLASLGSPAEPRELLSYHVLPSLVRELLGLSLVYTGPGVAPERSKTTRTHVVSRGGLTAEGLASRIHGDIRKGFICAEVAPAATLLQHASFAAAKDAGCVKTEGRDYVLSAGDVAHIRWRSG